MARQYFGEASGFSSNSSFPTQSPAEPKLPAQLSYQQAKLVNKAWTYFDSLLGSEWNKSRGRDVENGAIDTAVIAAMLKGLTAAGSRIYDPTTLSDTHNLQRPITALLPHILNLKLDLLEIMRDSIFDVTLPSYMGSVTREDVLKALVATGTGRTGFEKWVVEVERVRQAVQRDLEGREEEARVEATVLDPTTKVPSLSPPYLCIKSNADQIIL